MSLDRSEQQAIHAAPGQQSLGLGDLCFLAAVLLSTVIVGWLEVRGLKGDTIAYYDLSNAILQHRWHNCFNASWFPLYPAFLTAGRALFHFEPRYTSAAGRLVSIVLALGMFASACYLAVSIRRYVLARHTGLGVVLSRTSLLIWVTTLTFFLWSSDMSGQRPDTLLTGLLLLTTGLLVRGLTSARWPPFLLAGLTAGCAYWAKSFAFPFVGLLVLFLMLTQWKSVRTLLQLAATAVLFLCVATPYIAHISAQKHRFTIGDAGRLNSAWYVDGADRLNPVADPSVDERGSAQGTFLHPAELLATMPEIAYFRPGQVFGAMPAWDDFSFWSDGLESHFVPARTMGVVIANTKDMVALTPMRLQLLALFAAVWIFGLRLNPRRTLDPALLALVAASAASLVLYLLVHFEGRYVVFLAVLGGSIFAAAAHAALPPAPAVERRTVDSVRLHRVLLLIGFLVLLGEVQSSLRAFKSASSDDRPAAARFDVADYAAGETLASHFGPHAELACLGTEACYTDSLWAWYGDATVSAVVTLAHRQDAATSTEVCNALMQSGPASIEVLRTHGIRAVVAHFTNAPACSPQWQVIPDAPGYYLLPL